MGDEEDLALRRATRRLLFRSSNPEKIPGAGTSAARTPERHLKVKVTMNLDGDIVQHFKEQAKQVGQPYQSLLNQALRELIEGSKPERIAREVKALLLADDQFLHQLRSELSAPRGSRSEE